VRTALQSEVEGGPIVDQKGIEVIDRGRESADKEKSKLIIRVPDRG